MIICFLDEEEIAELHFQHLTDTMAGASNFLKQHQGSQEHKPLISTRTYTRSSIIINKAPSRLCSQSRWKEQGLAATSTGTTCHFLVKAVNNERATDQIAWLLAVRLKPLLPTFDLLINGQSSPRCLFLLFQRLLLSREIPYKSHFRQGNVTTVNIGWEAEILCFDNTSCTWEQKTHPFKLLTLAKTSLTGYNTKNQQCSQKHDDS